MNVISVKELFVYLIYFTGLVIQVRIGLITRVGQLAQHHVMAASNTEPEVVFKEP